MITIKDGDLLEATEDIIGHQVNCQGVMGSGVAKAIRDKYPVAYDGYKELTFSPELLGQVQLLEVGTGKYVANIFAQDTYGRTGKHTDYHALTYALVRLAVIAKIQKKSVALPYRIGAGTGGGDWGLIMDLIAEAFRDYDVTLYRLK